MLDRRRVLLVKPRTYMNGSGEAVGAILRYWKLEPRDMVVLVDDADLQVGQLRLRAKGSSGGHRGLESIIQEAGSPEFPRVRIGVGRDRRGKDLVKHVLTPFSPEERETVRRVVERAAEAVACILESDFSEAMNRYNGWVEN
jgi:PTH1 family peptidyl-tRNA hydrolase